MDLASFCDAMEKQRKSRFDKLYHSLGAVNPSVISPTAIGYKWRVPSDDLAKQLEAGLLEPFSGTEGYPTLYFTVLEKNDTRRRPIYWASEYLEQSGYASEFTLDTCAEYTQVVTQGSHAAAFDLKASYTQIVLPEDVHFVVVGRDGELYRLTRLPYGVDAAAEIMQLVTSELGRLAATAVENTAASFITKAHIDNALGVGQSVADVAQWAAAMTRLAEQFHITLNDEPANTPSQSLDFVGIDMDFKDKMVRLRDRFIQGLPTVNQAFKTYQDLESAVGKVLYGMAVLRVRQHPYHFFIKTWRRRLSRLNRKPDDPWRLKWQDEPDFSPDAKDTFGRMLQIVRDNKWAPVFPRRTALRSDLFDAGREKLYSDLPIIVTDATLDSFGVVLYENGRVTQAYGGRFAQKAPSMAVAESAAALAGVSRFADRIRNSTFVLLVDNTTTEISVRREHAKDLSIDLAVDLIGGILRDMNAKVLVARVASADNVADAPSRGKPLSDKCVANSLEAAEHAVNALKHTSVGEKVLRQARKAQLRGGVGRGNVR